MKFARIILILALLTGLAVAQQTSPDRPKSGELPILGTWSARTTDELTEEELWNPPVPADGFSIPKEHTPVYYILDGFFKVPVRVHVRHDDLDGLLEKVGVKPTATIKSHVLKLWARASDKSGRFSSLDKLEDSPAEWDREQYELITKEVKSFKRMYDAFLDACEDEGLDPDEVHENIVEFGRELTVIGAGGEIDPRQKAALRIFEPDSDNPYLMD